MPFPGHQFSQRMAGVQKRMGRDSPGKYSAPMRAAGTRSTRLSLLRFNATALCALLVTTVVRGGEPQWSVRTWQIPDGSANTVTGIVQSADGYLWVSTTAGV